MSLSTLTSVSAWTDYAALTPAALNTRLSILTTNLATLNTDAGTVLGAFYNVKSYGATGGGTIDDRASIQSCANAIQTAGGGTMLFPTGTFDVSSPVYIPQNIVVRGSGRGATIVRRRSSSVTNGTAADTGAVFLTGPSDGTTYLAASRGTNFAFYDLTIDGNASGNPGVTSNTPHADGLAFHHVDNVLCQSVTVRNCLNSGFYAFGARRTQSVACEARRNGQLGGAGSRNGFTVTGFSTLATDEGVQDEHSWTACSAISNVDAGFVFGRNGMVVYQGCIARDNGDAGIEGDSGSASTDNSLVPRGCIVQGSYFYNNLVGINLASGNIQRYTLIGNSIESHAEAGITVSNDDRSQIVITGNSIRTWGRDNANAHAVQVGGGFDEVIFRDNIVSGGSTAGFVILSGNTQRRVVTGGNIIRNTGAEGMSLVGSLTGIIGNDLIDNAGTIGIAVQANSGTTVLNLRFHGTLVKNSGDAGNNTGIRLRTVGANSVISGVHLNNVICTDDQASKTQTYGLTILESSTTLSTASVVNVRLAHCDFSGNATGTVTGEVAWTWSPTAIDSLSTQSFQGTLNMANARLSVRTAASLDSLNLVGPEIAFSVGGASGASLAIRSGSTIYYFASSASTKG